MGRGGADFEDDRVQLNKDNQIRRRYLGWFNKRRDDFESDVAYDDYLEMVEDTIHKLVHNIDIDATKAFVDKYRQANQQQIGQNKAKRADEQRLQAEKIAAMERARVARLIELRNQDRHREEERLRIRRRNHAEQLLRISRGDEALEKARRKRQKLERKRKRKDAAAARALEEQARADEMAVRVRPMFPHPPPAPRRVANVTHDLRPMEQKAQLDPDRLAKAAKAAGFQQRLVYFRALAEFTQSVQMAQRLQHHLCS